MTIRRDTKPELVDWRDDGCSLHPHCLTCPLPRCRYEMGPGQARALADWFVLRDVLADGRTVEQAAADLGVSRRTVYRLRARHEFGGKP